MSHKKKTFYGNGLPYVDVSDLTGKRAFDTARRIKEMA
jgi:hypothetical protein